MLDRDAILTALRNRISELVPGLRTCTRRERDWSITHLPAVLVRTEGMVRDDLGRWEIDALLNLLIHVPDTEQSPESRLNVFLDAIDAALAAQPDEADAEWGRTTLGGACRACRILGRIEVNQGADGVAEAVIPIQIEAYEQD